MQPRNSGSNASVYPKNSSKNSAQQSHSRLVNFHFICNLANCQKQKNKCYFQKMLSPESPGGTTSQVSCEFSTFHPPKVWYPPPAGDRPPKDTLRVVTITNTGLLQRQVKQKKLRMLAMPAMARNLSLFPNAGPKQIRLVSSLLRFL